MRKNKQKKQNEESKEVKGEIKVALYFIVALKIWTLLEKGEEVWFSKLTKSFDKVFLKRDVGIALDILEDWQIIRYEYGETTPGHAGRLIKFRPEGKSRMKSKVIVPLLEQIIEEGSVSIEITGND